jgi:hypothetical protein
MGCASSNAKTDLPKVAASVAPVESASAANAGDSVSAIDLSASSNAKVDAASVSVVNPADPPQSSSAPPDTGMQDCMHDFDAVHDAVCVELEAHPEVWVREGKDMGKVLRPTLALNPGPNPILAPTLI